MGNIELEQETGALAQLSNNNSKIYTHKEYITGDISGGTTIGKIRFPFPIRVVGLSATAAVAVTNTLTFTVTDGTTALTVTIAGGATEQQDTEDQYYAADTTFTISNAASVGATTEIDILSIHYIIPELYER